MKDLQSTTIMSQYEGYEKEGVDIFGIRFVPLWIPLKRRWETFCVVFFLIIGPFIWPFMPFIYIYLLFYSPSVLWPLLFFFIWYIYDRDTPHTGGRENNFITRWCTSIRDYFPSKIVKTVDLPANTNYLIGSFPHGVICLGMISNFIMDANFRETFPELRCRPIALDHFFYMPIVRECFLWCGASASSARNLYYLLTSEKKNNAVVLMVGGAAESLLAKPGFNKVTINNRKGFVKLALKTGASLVPAYTFGENEIFDQKQSEAVTKFQHYIRGYTGIPPILMKGRGIFQYTFGLLPRRRPLTTVVGRPIAVPKCENPTQEQIEEYHAKFKEELIAVFDANKEKYDTNGKDTELICT